MLYVIIILLVILCIIGIGIFLVLNSIDQTLCDLYNNDNGIFNNILKQLLIMIHFAEKEGFNAMEIFDDYREREVQKRRDIRDEIEQSFQ